MKNSTCSIIRNHNHSHSVPLDVSNIWSTFLFKVVNVLLFRSYVLKLREFMMHFSDTINENCKLKYVQLWMSLWLLITFIATVAFPATLTNCTWSVYMSTCFIAIWGTLKGAVFTIFTNLTCFKWQETHIALKN